VRAAVAVGAAGAGAVAASSCSSVTVAGLGVVVGILLPILEVCLTEAELALDMDLDSDFPGDVDRRVSGSNAQEESLKCLAHSSAEYLTGGAGGDGGAVPIGNSVLLSWKVFDLGCWRKAFEPLREGVDDVRPVALAAAKTLLLLPKSPAHCEVSKDVLMWSSLRLFATLGLKVSALMGMVNLVKTCQPKGGIARKARTVQASSIVFGKASLLGCVRVINGQIDEIRRVRGMWWVFVRGCLRGR
jgi:hypothetical protein